MEILMKIPKIQILNNNMKAFKIQRLNKIIKLQKINLV